MSCHGLAEPSRFDPTPIPLQTTWALDSQAAEFNRLAAKFMEENMASLVAIDLYHRARAAEIAARRPLAPVVQLTLPNMTTNPAFTYQKAAS